MKTKRIAVEISAEELLHHSRVLVVEVPEDVTGDEIQSISADIFDDVPEPPKWHLEESDGIRIYCEAHPKVMYIPSNYEQTDAVLQRGADGRLELRESSAVTET